MLFKELNLKPGLLRGVDEIGFVNTMPIQQIVLPLALEGKSIVGQSQTGTGKTAAFLLPVLNNIDSNLVEIQALILVPTRELVVQIYEEIYKLTKYYRIPAANFYGGVSIVNQVVEIKRNPRIIIATPGRLLDLQEQGYLKLSTIKYLVLDEVDRMLDMGFGPSIKKIRNKIPKVQQVFSFSATLNDSIMDIIKTYKTDFELIKSGDEIIVDKIDHSYLTVENKDKYINLTNLLVAYTTQKIIVFTNTISTCNALFQKLDQQFLKVAVLNGDINQSKRLNTLSAFTKGKVKILITTDVASRGLNMDNVGLVINFDVPKESDSYIHRIGRTARAGASGKAIMFVTPREEFKIHEFEFKYDIQISKANFDSIKSSQSTKETDGKKSKRPSKKSGGTVSKDFDGKKISKFYEKKIMDKKSPKKKLLDDKILEEEYYARMKSSDIHEDRPIRSRYDRTSSDSKSRSNGFNDKKNGNRKLSKSDDSLYTGYEKNKF